MAEGNKLLNWANNGAPPSPKNGNNPPVEEDETDMEGGAYDGEDENPDGEEAADLAERFGDVIEMLEAHGEDLESEAENFDLDVLNDPNADEDDEFLSMMGEASSALDSKLMDLVHEKLADITIEDAEQIASHLEEGGHITDPELVGPFLFHLATST